MLEYLEGALRGIELRRLSASRGTRVWRTDEDARYRLHSRRISFAWRALRFKPKRIEPKPKRRGGWGYV